MVKKIIKVIFLISFLSLFLFLYLKDFKIKESKIEKKLPEEEITYNSNILQNVNYTSKDTKGNEYIIKALKGEIDFSNNNIIYLTNVSALIKLNNSKNIRINSDFGKYNTINNNTIFSQNVMVDYLDNKIISEYLDFSMKRNSMIISRNVVYTNLENILKADVIEVDIKTKDTKIFMYESNKKVKVKSKN
tara:strand:- start:2187 stop:2756 length:570 start_codon:yes stop_codon:yes gene_type:complete